MKLLKTLVADDHDIFLDGLENVLAEIREIHVIGRASNGNEVIRQLGSGKVDLLILDINMPHCNGFDILDFIRQQGLNTKVVVLSFYTDYTLIKKILLSGALSYVSKEEGKKELIQAVRAAAHEKRYLPKGVKKIIEWREETHVPADDFIGKYNLTKRELQVLTEVARELSSAEIADKLCLSEYTVETYRKSIIRKLNAKNTASLVNFAHRWNLI